MNNLTETFRSSILSSDSIALAKDYSEAAIDSVVDEGLLKEIPIIGSLISFYKLGRSIKEQHTVKKIVTFLNQMDKISEEEKKDFLKRLGEEDKQGRLFEKILTTLDKLDEVVKAEMIGNLFRMYILGVLDKELFLRCCNIVERGYISDLIRLHQDVHQEQLEQERPWNDLFIEYVDEGRRYSEIYNQNLYSLGLIRGTIERKVEDVINNNTDSSDLNDVGRATGMFIYYDLENEKFKEYMNTQIIMNQPYLTR